MTDIAAVNVAVKLEFTDRTSRRKRHEVKLTFGDGILTYPTHGIPLPALRAGFGFHAGMPRLDIEQPQDGYIYSYDKTYYTLRIWQQSALVGALVEFSGAIAATTLYATAYGA